MPRNTWPDALKFATYTKNRIPHSALPDQKSPIEILDPSINILEERSNLHPYGELLIIHDYDIRNKLAPRSHQGRIIGYTSTYKVYWTLAVDGQKWSLAKDPKPVIGEGYSQEITVPILHPQASASAEEESENMAESESEGVNISESEGYETVSKGEQTPKVKSPARTITPELTSMPPAINAPQKRYRRTPADFAAEYGIRPPSGRRSKPSRKLFESTRDQNHGGNEDVFAVGTDPDHPTDQQARFGPHRAEWALARSKERTQLQKYGVYTVVKDIPEGVNSVDTKWVYVIKRKADGSIEKFKGRKVGRGFTQQLGIDYDKTHAQTMRAETMKILMVIALSKGWKIRQWDVVGAYLQAPLQHSIYVTDINEQGETEYWKLHKALYGLKQAGHLWYDMLTHIMSKAGFCQCVGDEGVFIPTNHDNGIQSKAIIGTWVDDLVGIAPDNTDLNQLEEEIEKHVELERRG